jgi:hypothetical protein
MADVIMEKPEPDGALLKSLAFTRRLKSAAMSPKSLLAGAILVVSLATALPGPRPGHGQVCNGQSSLTLIYQNNLNASDDVNHVSAIVLDPIPGQGAASACGVVNEQLLSQATLQNYTADFASSLAYLDYKYKTGSSFQIENAVVTAKGDSLSFAAQGTSHGNFPVLCTQSDRASQPQNSTPTASNLITVNAAGNAYVGYRNLKSFRFAGIRYAETPERFEYSKLYSGTGEIVNATAYGDQCLQPFSGGSEDCLFLNIQTPYIPKAGARQQKLRPVYFWIHGTLMVCSTMSEVITIPPHDSGEGLAMNSASPSYLQKLTRENRRRIHWRHWFGPRNGWRQSCVQGRRSRSYDQLPS